MRPEIAGLLINSALYLVAVFVAALIEGNRVAELAAITGMGVNYLSYAGQIMFAAQVRWNTALVLLSIATGVFAGLALLVS